MSALRLVSRQSTARGVLGAVLGRESVRQLLSDGDRLLPGRLQGLTVEQVASTPGPMTLLCQPLRDRPASRALTVLKPLVHYARPQQLLANC